MEKRWDKERLLDLEKRLLKRTALSVMINIIDCNNGQFVVNSSKVKRAFNDEDDIVKLEYTDGTIGLAADADFETLHSANMDWIDNNPDRVDEVMKAYMKGV